jgi:purine-binding chemotaxis protein CheW
MPNLNTEASEKNSVVSDKKYVSFTVGHEYFGIPIDEVRQIIRLPKVTRVPKMPTFVLGISNLRGSVLPVIDLSLRLGYANPCVNSEDTRVIVTERRGLEIGFVVESVSEVKATESGAYEDFPDMPGDTADKKFITGVLKMQTKEGLRLVQVLDSQELVNIEGLKKYSDDTQIRQQSNIKDESQYRDIADFRRFISFEIDSHAYAIEIHRINEIIRLPEYVAVPGAGSDMLGLFSLRGIVIPLLSLHRRFGKKDMAGNEDTRVVIIEVNGTKFGFMADKVNEVLSVPESAIEEPPRAFSEKGKEISAIIKADQGERLIMILETEEILANTEAEALRKLAQQEGGQLLMNEVQTGADQEKQIVTFTLGDEEYGIYIEKVQEINRYVGVTRVPKTPTFVEGIINLRGEVIPLIDLRKRFDLNVREKDEFTRVIIVNIENVRVGLVVDFVDEVLRVNARSIDNVPELFSNGIDNRFLNGVVNIDKQERMILLLDVDELFSKAERKKLEKLGS